VDLAIYDLMGREVRVLARGRTFAAGRWSLGWDGRQGDGQAAGAGVYFVRLRAGAGSWSRTLVRIR
jgi:hypothetical protein